MVKYKVSDKGCSKRYFVQVPNMIDDIKMSVYAFRLYVHMKRVAGDDGLCYQSTRTLATSCYMSAGSVSKAKIELAELSLIAIDEQPTTRGGKDFHAITIADIWDKNFAAYASSPHERGSSPGEIASSPHEQPSSPGEIKNNSFKNNPIKKNKDKEIMTIPSSLMTANFLYFWDEWRLYRKEKKKTLTPRTIKMQLKKLEAVGEEEAIKMITQSIEQGWIGLFPFKNNKKNDGQPAAMGAIRRARKELEHENR